MGRKRRLETKSGRKICREDAVGCRSGRIDTGDGLPGANLRRAVCRAVNAKPSYVVVGIVKVEENVFVPGAVGFGCHGRKRK